MSGIGCGSSAGFTGSGASATGWLAAPGDAIDDVGAAPAGGAATGATGSFVNAGNVKSNRYSGALSLKRTFADICAAGGEAVDARFEISPASNQRERGQLSRDVGGVRRGARV